MAAWCSGDYEGKGDLVGHRDTAEVVRGAIAAWGAEAECMAANGVPPVLCVYSDAGYFDKGGAVHRGIRVGCHRPAIRWGKGGITGAAAHWGRLGAWTPASTQLHKMRGSGCVVCDDHAG